MLLLFTHTKYFYFFTFIIIINIIIIIIIIFNVHLWAAHLHVQWILETLRYPDIGVRVRVVYPYT